METIEMTTPNISYSTTYVATEINASPPKSPVKLYNLLKKSIRAIRSPGKRQEMDEGEDTRIELGPMGRRSPSQEQDLESVTSRLSKCSTRCTDGTSDPYYQEPRCTLVSEVADFSDLEDPFACHTLGSPQIVKDIDSALPPKSPPKNKEGEARRRTRQRPQSAGANNPPPRSKVEWRVVASAQSAALRRVCVRSSVTPRRTPSMRSSRWKPLPTLPPISTILHQHGANSNQCNSSPPSHRRLTIDIPRTSIDVY